MEYPGKWKAEHCDAFQVIEQYELVKKSQEVEKWKEIVRHFIEFYSKAALKVEGKGIKWAGKSEMW